MWLAQLPKGVTGFDKPDDVPFTKASHFKAACYTVAQSQRGRVETFEVRHGLSTRRTEA
jgi:hypothetical protein